MTMNWDFIKKPNGFKIEENKADEGYIKVSVEPLMRGYGNTVGNALRRILLSSMEGSAIYGFMMDGVEHPLSTVDGVVEDTTQIILNLKNVRLSCVDDEAEVRIKRKGPVIITAGDLEKENSKVHVVNKNLEIINITAKREVDVTLYIKKNVNFEISDNIATEGKPVGFIPVDALFSPVTKVKYDVIEDIRVGTERNYEKVIFEIWHDRTMNGENFIPFAGKIAKDIFGALINFDDEDEKVAPKAVSKKAQSDPMDEILDKDIDELELSKRPANCLRSSNVNKIKQLVSMTRDELMKMKNLGSKSLKEIEEKLKQRNLYLGMNIKKRG